MVVFLFLGLFNVVFGGICTLSFFDFVFFFGHVVFAFALFVFVSIFCL